MRTRRHFGLCLVLVLLAAGRPTNASAAANSDGHRVRVVITLEEGVRSSVAASPPFSGVIETLQSASRLERWGAGRTFSVEIDRSELERLSRDPGVRAIAIDTGGSGGLTESLPLIGVDVVRAQGYDGRGVVVAILDTGIDAANRDFEGRIVEERCYCDNLDGTGCCPGGAKELSGPGAALDDNGHGTHVSGILAGGGAVAPAGVASRSLIVAIKVMDRNNTFQSFTQIYKALAWIADHRPDVRVVNMSLGSFALYGGSDCDADAIAFGLEEVIGRLRSRGVVFTASSGNQASTNSVTLPACMTSVLGVGATYDAPGSYSFSGCADSEAGADEVTCFTNSSAAVDLLAPGAPIRATARGGGAITYSGTSMAAPHVAGVAALMQQASGGATEAAELERLLRDTGRLVMDSRNALVFPRLDAAAAVAATPRPSGTGRRRSTRHGESPREESWRSSR